MMIKLLQMRCCVGPCQGTHEYFIFAFSIWPSAHTENVFSHLRTCPCRCELPSDLGPRCSYLKQGTVWCAASVWKVSDLHRLPVPETWATFRGFCDPVATFFSSEPCETVTFLVGLRWRSLWSHWMRPSCVLVWRLHFYQAGGLHVATEHDDVGGWGGRSVFFVKARREIHQT